MKLHSTSFFYVALFSVAIYLELASSVSITQEAAIKQVGDTFLVTCHDENGGQVRWNGSNGPLTYYTQPRMIKTLYGTSILFTLAKASDTGIYECYSLSDKKYFNLTVTNSFKQPKYRQEAAERVLAYKGSVISLICEFDTELMPNFKWFLGTQLLNNTEEINIKSGLSSRISILQLYVREATMGVYSCLSDTSMEELKKSFKILDASLYPDLINLNLNKINSNSLDFNIENNNFKSYFPKDSNVSEFRIEYRIPIIDKEWNSQEVTSTNGLHVLTGLEENTEYKIRLVAKTSTGLSYYSKPSTFKTSPFISYMISSSAVPSYTVFILMTSVTTAFLNV